MRNLLIIAACIIAFSPPAYGREGMDFFERKAEGWFWHEDPPAPVEELPPEPPPAPEPEEVQEKDPEPESASPTEPPKDPGPAPLSTEWIRVNLPKYLDRAIDNPTEENVAAWLYLQKLSMDKSEKFTQVAKYVVMGDPILDENTRRPLAGWGSQIADEQSTENRGKVLKKIAKDAGIWFFYASDCPYCESQVYTQKNLKKWYGFETLPITLDGSRIKTDFEAFQNPIQDQGQAEMLQIIQYPALFLTKPSTGEIIPIAQGYFAADQMADRILMAAHGAGWISDTEYKRTKPMRSSLMDPTDRERDFESPEELMQFLRKSFPSEVSNVNPD